MNLPADLSPETAAWMRVQMTIAATRAVEPLKAEINKVDDWANGVFAVFLDVLPFLLKLHPDLAGQLEPQWRKVAKDYDQINLHGGQPNDGEPLEFLEARKMLFRIFELQKLWPGRVRQPAVKAVPQRRRA